jgi:hypothetical protein
MHCTRTNTTPQLLNQVICKHNYYKHYRSERTALLAQMAAAVDRLELLVKRMDDECVNHATKVLDAASLTSNGHNKVTT